MDQGGSSVRHPKGARSIGIGHPRSGDRCTETRPYPFDPLRVAEQKSSFSATRKGSRPNAFAYTDSSPAATASRSRRGEAPEGSSLFRPGVEARSAEDPGKEDLGKDIRPRQGVALPRQSVRHPSGVAGSLAMPDPRVFGATPLDPGLKSGHPCRGASFSTIHNDLNGPLHHSNASPMPSTLHVRLVRGKMVNFAL